MKKKLKVLLLENINTIARDSLMRAGFEVELQKNALPTKDLIAALKNFDALGIRSKTNVTDEVIKSSPQLLTVGCFCIGTNQVDLKTAKSSGIPVFNAPFSNTRSVAEMTISNIIALSRKIGTRNIEMHSGTWNKESDGCFEVRGKTLGIIGYGNIGTQVSMMAENLGMRVVFYDIITKLTLGNASPVGSLTELFQESDFITLHVPETELTKNMIGHDELKTMKKGAYILNASRGTVMDLQALAQSIESGHIAGAAVDVFPVEPTPKTDKFKTELAGLQNVILTPHIGGATEEAQVNIGNEVAHTLIRFLSGGATRGAVNFPMLDAPRVANSYRILNVHKNVPGVLKDINRIVAEMGANILGQSLTTDSELGYLSIDLDTPVSEDVIKKINSAPNMIRTRLAPEI